LKKKASAKTLFELEMLKVTMTFEKEIPLTRERIAPGATPEEAAILDRLLIDINVRHMAEKFSLMLMARAIEVLKEGDSPNPPTS
jgi:hypothetical protein